MKGWGVKAGHMAPSARYRRLAGRRDRWPGEVIALGRLSPRQLDERAIRKLLSERDRTAMEGRDHCRSERRACYPRDRRRRKRTDDYPNRPGT